LRGDLLREVGVGEVLDLDERQGVLADGKGEDRAVGRIDLAVDGRIGQGARKVVGRGVEAMTSGLAPG